jgi:uncharacterized protein (DUF488 family)
MTRPDIWTVGHSTHSFDAFMELLEAHGIMQVADVRTVPRSRRHPHFDVAALAQELPARSVAYAHLPRLGGWRRPGPGSLNAGWRNPSFRGYADYAMGEQFASGLAELRQLSVERRTAVMCSEALWWRCHRRLIADYLVVDGLTVCHIGSDGNSVVHQLTPFARALPDGHIVYAATG